MDRQQEYLTRFCMKMDGETSSFDVVGRVTLEKMSAPLRVLRTASPVLVLYFKTPRLYFCPFLYFSLRAAEASTPFLDFKMR